MKHRRLSCSTEETSTPLKGKKPAQAKARAKRASAPGDGGHHGRKPVWYWAEFNAWWREQLARQGKRPGKFEINAWYAANATDVWPDETPTLRETCLHAKCLRSTEAVREYFRRYRAARREQDLDTSEESCPTTEEDASLSDRDRHCSDGSEHSDEDMIDSTDPAILIASSNRGVMRATAAAKRQAVQQQRADGAAQGPNKTGSGSSAAADPMAAPKGRRGKAAAPKGPPKPGAKAAPTAHRSSERSAATGGGSSQSGSGGGRGRSGSTDGEAEASGPHARSSSQPHCPGPNAEPDHGGEEERWLPTPRSRSGSAAGAHPEPYLQQQPAQQQPAYGHPGMSGMRLMQPGPMPLWPAAGMGWIQPPAVPLHPAMVMRMSMQGPGEPLINWVPPPPPPPMQQQPQQRQPPALQHAYGLPPRAPQALAPQPPQPHQSLALALGPMAPLFEGEEEQLLLDSLEPPLQPLQSLQAPPPLAGYGCMGTVTTSMATGAPLGTLAMAMAVDEAEAGEGEEEEEEEEEEDLWLMARGLLGAGGRGLADAPAGPAAAAGGGSGGGGGGGGSCAMQLAAQEEDDCDVPEVFWDALPAV